MAKTEAKETSARTSKSVHVRERLGTPTDLKVGSDARYFRRACWDCWPDVLRALYEDQELSLAHERARISATIICFWMSTADQIFAMTDPIAERGA